MSNKVSSDVFGKRVAKRFYCIEVKIGNNSAHALQIAGIGFDNKDVYGTRVKQANSSYAATRAVLQRESTISTRNVIYHSIEASGLLMAAFTPFFARTNPHKNWLAATTIVSGALVQALDIVRPDRVPGQLNNLDDESLRDRKVIANNTQVRTTIFVEKKQLTEALAQARQTLAQKIGTKQPLADVQANQLADLEAKQLADREGKKTVENSEHEGFSGSESPFLIRMALGDLVLVGDPIEYLPRVQIVSNPSSGAIAVSVSPQDPSVTVKSKQNFTATVTGTSTTTVTWSVSCAASAAKGAAACGTIDPSGAYTAPDTVPNPITVAVTATSTADTTKSDSAKVTITAPVVSLSPTNLTLSSKGLGTTSSPQPVTLANIGNAPLTITKIEPTTTADAIGFATTNTCGALPATLVINGRCTITVTFTPTAAAAVTGTLLITDNAADLQQKVSLSGTVTH